MGFSIAVVHVGVGFVDALVVGEMPRDALRLDRG
jgi:hypothetical protein